MSSFNYNNFTINKEKEDFHKCPIKSGCYCDVDNNKENPYKWDFLDAIYCICLKDREDRLLTSSNRFHQYGLCQYITYYRPVKDISKHVDSASSRGCWNSHRYVIKKAKELNYKHILIFEDDVYFSSKYNPKKVNTIKNCLKILPFNWDIFYLGHVPLYSRHYKKNIFKTKSICLHAYIVNLKNNLTKNIIKLPYDYQDNMISIDNWIPYNFETYALNKMIAFQDNSITSNPKIGMLKSITDYGLAHHEYFSKKAENIASTLPLIIIFLFFIFILILFRIFRK